MTPPADLSPAAGEAEHPFRVLHETASPHEPDDPETESDSEGDPEEPAAPPVSFRAALREGFERRLFDLCLRVLYHGVAPVARTLIPRARDPIAGRPLRAVRVLSKIVQGGVAKVAVQTMHAIPAEEVETTILVFDDKKATLPALERRPGIRLDNRKLRLWPGSYRRLFFRDALKLAVRIRRARPDVVHVHEPQFAPAARIAAAFAGGVPVVIHMHNDYTRRNTSMRPPQSGIYKHALRRCRLVACSRTILDAAVEFLGETRYPIRLIEDGTDDVPDRAPDERLRADLRRAAGDRKIVAKMAHLAPHKRIEDFLSAGRVLLDEGYPIFVLLMAYGKEKSEAAMRERFEATFAPEEGEFLYRVRAPQHVLGMVDVGVSTSRLEGLGLNVLEYQIEGVPVVCTDLKPHREMVVDGETGLLFPPEDVAQLVRRLRRILSEPDLAKRIGEAGRESARKRSWKNTAKATVELYRETAGG